MRGIFFPPFFFFLPPGRRLMCAAVDGHERVADSSSAEKLDARVNFFFFPFLFSLGHVGTQL